MPDFERRFKKNNSKKENSGKEKNAGTAGLKGTSGSDQGLTEDLFSEKEPERLKMDAMGQFKDAARGCLAGGAAGDALGYPVEFMSYDSILHAFGKPGITDYTEPKDGEKPAGGPVCGTVSDDTQMTLFTAAGLLEYDGDAAKDKLKGEVHTYVWQHYLDWLSTQSPSNAPVGRSCLLEIEGLRVRRAPGNTCLSALKSGKCGTVLEPLNNSSGCGGVMRVAPVAVYPFPGLFPELAENGTPLTLAQLETIDRIGADVAAITHGHPLGYIPAAALVHIIHRLIYGGCTAGEGLDAIAAECRTALQEIYAEEPQLSKFLELFDRAVSYAGNDLTDIENIRSLGEGWVGDEAFAIALYCSLRHRDSFEDALIAAVNHSGDSDSTGAICGNIMGALLGHDAVSEKWFSPRLEFHSRIIVLADALCLGYWRYEDDAFRGLGQSAQYFTRMTFIMSIQAAAEHFRKADVSCNVKAIAKGFQNIRKTAIVMKPRKEMKDGETLKQLMLSVPAAWNPDYTITLYLAKGTRFELADFIESPQGYRLLRKSLIQLEHANGHERP